MDESDNLVFVDETQTPVSPQDEQSDALPWRVLIIDDEEVIHAITRLVLADYSFKGHRLELISGYSGKQAKQLIAEHPDTAVILLDVVMESGDAGLQVVDHIRNRLKNQFVRIILRTGQPGQAPEHAVITEYDINDYREKSDLTAQKLVSALTTSLRAYQDLRTIEGLIISNDQLEQCVTERNQELTQANQALKLKIKEKQQVTSELEKNQQKLHSIINNSPSIIYLKDIEGRYLLINQPFEKSFIPMATASLERPVLIFFQNRWLSSSKLTTTRFWHRLKRHSSKNIFQGRMVITPISQSNFRCWMPQASPIGYAVSPQISLIASGTKRSYGRATKAWLKPNVLPIWEIGSGRLSNLKSKSRINSIPSWALAESMME